jgi:hypothetical protein
MALAGIVLVTCLTVVAWKVMLPLIGMAALVATFLRRSRSEDAL